MELELGNKVAVLSIIAEQVDFGYYLHIDDVLVEDLVSKVETHEGMSLYVGKAICSVLPVHCSPLSLPLSLSLYVCVCGMCLTLFVSLSQLPM